ncbi:MAG TPA: N-acetylglucosamine-6-phosphate deacetylase [archaeon]|nr:N-acetylglucosamine-6-phosphate deacetylase [archaeon]
MPKKISRKDFFKVGSAAATSLGISSAAVSCSKETSAFESDNLVKIPGRDYCWRVRLEKERLVELSRTDHTSTDLWLTRGLVDIQVNGYQGIELTSPDLTLDGLAKCEEALAAQGLARWCPTVTSQDPELIREVLAKIAEGVEKGALRRVLCIHLEANYLSSEEGYRGAHIPRYQKDPEIKEFESWQKAAGGRIGYVSLAPERKGAIDFIRYLTSNGILASLAHHNAPFEVVSAAADAGARLSTHLFNGCASMMHRHHNVILTQLAEDRLWASFIPDGHHIPYHVLKVGLRAKGLGRSVLTSDLVHLGGMPEGEYFVDEQEVEVRSGGAFVKGTPYLFGAWASLAQGIERVTASGIIPPGDALRLASQNPARLFGIQDSLEPAVGSSGPFVTFREQKGALKLESII